MRNKYFYPIFKLKTKSWIRYWLLKKTEFKGKLSDILTGFSFNLQNTLRQKFVKFEIEGNSVQNGEPSPENEQPIKSCGDNVNLFDLQNGEQGAIDASGNYVDNPTNWRATDYIKVKPNTTYSFSIDRKNITTVNYLRIYEYNSSKTFISPRIESNANANLIFTTGQNTEYIKYTIYISDVTATLNLITSIKPKLEQDSQPTPYSPYGMGSITEKIVNKNWFDGEFINGSDSVPDSVYYLFSKNDLKLKNNTYTFSNSLPNSFSYAILGCINSFPNSDTKQYNSGWKTGGTSLTFTFSQELYFGVLIKKSDSSTIQPGDISNYRFNLVQGSTASDYVIHEEQTYSIYTQQPMRSIGDVRDCFVKVNGEWKERHNSVRSILNGTEYIDLNSEYNNSYSFSLKEFNTIIDKSSATNILCNILKAETNNEPSTIRIATGSGNIIMCFSKDFISYNVDTFKTYLSTQYANGTPVYIDYILATPTDLPCTQEQIAILENLPITYEGQTNIYSTDEVEPFLEIQYWESDTNG